METTLDQGKLYLTGGGGNFTVTAIWTPNTYWLNINILDGNGAENSTAGTFQISYDGWNWATLGNEDGSARAFDSTFYIRNISPAAGRYFSSVSCNGNLSQSGSGQNGPYTFKQIGAGSGNIDIHLGYNSYYLDWNPTGATNPGVDVYINGSLVASGVGDYCKQHPYGTGYLFIPRGANGYTGWLTSGNLSGTIGAGDVATGYTWTANEYYVTYNANGGSGAPATQKFLYNSGATISSTVPTRSGYTFAYWDYAGNHFSPGQAIPSGWGSFNLTACWYNNYYTIIYEFPAPWALHVSTQVLDTNKQEWHESNSELLHRRTRLVYLGESILVRDGCFVSDSNENHYAGIYAYTNSEITYGGTSDFWDTGETVGVKWATSGGDEFWNTYNGPFRFIDGEHGIINGTLTLYPTRDPNY